MECVAPDIVNNTALIHSHEQNTMRQSPSTEQAE
jgi:hypothetical protein